MRRIFIAAVIVLTALITGCGSSHTGQSTAAAAPAPAFLAPHGFDLSAMDTSVKACDDFYRFAVGKWRETHPLPAQYSRYGRFEELAERNREVLHKILEEDAAMTNAAPQGNLRNWFTPEDLKNFQGRTDCVANEYSEFNVAQGININGKLVNGESVADLGGATIALRAYEKSLEGKQRQSVDGFTPEQRFFLGFAQVWGENMSPQEATRRALTDPHAQGPFRVNGTVQNMPEFWKAYNCTDSDKMVRDAAKRCSIW